jgi:hypothetical protein
MVNGNTASAYGDFLIASIKTPYANLKKIISWNILSGVSDASTTGLLTFTLDSVIVNGINTDFHRLFQNTNQIIVGNNILTIDSIVSSTELILSEPSNFSATNIQFYRPLSVDNNFEYSFRISIDGGKIYSEFAPLNNENNPGDLLNYNWDNGIDLFIDFGAEVSALLTGSKLTFIASTLTIETIDGIIESCPQFCTTCTDPFIYSGCATIEILCDNASLGNIFQPYRQFRSQQTYMQLTNIVTGIFGHEVTYFRTEPDTRTKDVILMEYSLHNVVSQNTLKVLVPDNEFPQESTMSYDLFGMEFEEFEIHVTQQQFQSVFGFGKSPRNKDYLYFPLINKMYTINSVALGDRFNEAITYWKLKLIKYQNDTSVIKNTFGPLTDSIVTDIDEVFGEEIKEEYTKNIKPETYKTVSTSYRDGIRKRVFSNLKIVDSEIKNRWTVVSKNYYDLNTVPLDEVAVEYEAPIVIKDGFAFTCWFAPTVDFNDSAYYWLFGNGTINQGLKISVNGQNIKVQVNDNEFIFNHNAILAQDRWYAIVLNANTQFNQLSFNLYSLDPTNNHGLPQSRTNDLTNIYSETKNQINNISWDVKDGAYNLRGSKLKLTNIRLFNTPIEYEEHSNVLNQYVVRDNQYSIIVDNAIPSLGYQKFRGSL